MGGVKPTVRAAHDAGSSSDGGALRFGRRHRGCSLQRLVAPKRFSSAQPGAPAQWCALHRCSFEIVAALRPLSGVAGSVW